MAGKRFTRMALKVRSPWSSPRVSASSVCSASFGPMPSDTSVAKTVWRTASRGVIEMTAQLCCRAFSSDSATDSHHPDAVGHRKVACGGHCINRYRQDGFASGGRGSHGGGTCNRCRQGVGHRGQRPTVRHSSGSDDCGAAYVCIGVVQEMCLARWAIRGASRPALAPRPPPEQAGSRSQWRR